MRCRCVASSGGGYTFVELLVVTRDRSLILASAIMPLARVTIQRQKEIELRRDLREMRTAIDQYKDAADQGMIGALDLKVGNEGYPPDLETLVEGVPAAGRRLRPEAEVPAPHSDRPDDRQRRSGGCGRTRTSPTRPPGAARTSTTCSHHERRHRARRNEVPRLVAP